MVVLEPTAVRALPASTSSPPTPSAVSVSNSVALATSALVAARAMAAQSSSAAMRSQYLNPDYITPLPAEMDTKSSPLALLAKTCSQIGADATPVNGRSNSGSTGSKTPGAKSPNSVNGRDELTPNGLGGSSRASSADIIRVSDNNGQRSSPPAARPGSSSSSISSKPKTPSNRPPASTSASSNSGSSPIIRSGLEVLAGNTSLSTSHSSSAAPPRVPSPASQLRSPSFNPFLASFLPTTTSAAAPVGSMPTPSLYSHPGPASLGACRDPMCRDPLCPTNILRSQQQLMAMSSAGGASTQMLAAAAHQRAALMAAAVAASSHHHAARPPPPPSAATSSPHLPYICNWVSGAADYCGRRFANSEELLLHLKTHTSAAAAAAAASEASRPPILHATSRFHPYARAGLGAHMSLPLPPPPTALSGLPPPSSYMNPYASLYPGLFSRPPLL